MLVGQLCNGLKLPKKFLIFLIFLKYTFYIDSSYGMTFYKSLDIAKQ